MNTHKPMPKATHENPKLPSARPSGSAEWQYRTSNGVNIWTWEAQRGLKYMVTQLANNIQAHITRGEAHKFTSTMGSYATVDEARHRCVDDWQNTERTDRRGGGSVA